MVQMFTCNFWSPNQECFCILQSCAVGICMLNNFLLVLVKVDSNERVIG